MSFLDGIKKAIVVAEKIGIVAGKVKQGAEKVRTLTETVAERKGAGLCPGCGAKRNTPPIAQGLCEPCLGKLAAGVLEGAEMFR